MCTSFLAAINHKVVQITCQYKVPTKWVWSIIRALFPPKQKILDETVMGRYKEMIETWDRRETKEMMEKMDINPEVLD